MPARGANCLLTTRRKGLIIKVSRQIEGVLFSIATNHTQSSIVGKAPFTRIRPICLDSGGTTTCEGRFAMCKEEVWKDIPCFPGYQVSDLGRVASLKQRKRASRGWMITTSHQRILSPDSSRNYRTVILCRCGIQACRKISVLVALAFLGPRPKGMQVCHNDGNSHNDELTNIRYDTPQNNARDTVIHGRKGRFTRSQICDIRAQRADGIDANSLAAEYETTPAVISNIAGGRRYAVYGGPLTQLSHQEASAKITADTAKEIRERYQVGDIAMKKLGSHYGLSESAVSLIVNHKRWS